MRGVGKGWGGEGGGGGLRGSERTSVGCGRGQRSPSVDDGVFDDCAEGDMGKRGGLHHGFQAKFRFRSMLGWTASGSSLQEGASRLSAGSTDEGSSWGSLVTDAGV